jgi:hypothetical protein
VTNSASITLQLPSELLRQIQQLAGNPEALQDFLIDAIEHEVQRHQLSAHAPDFWERVEKLRTRMKDEGIEIDPDEIWGDVRDRSPGREVSFETECL